MGTASSVMVIILERLPGSCLFPPPTVRISKIRNPLLSEMKDFDLGVPCYKYSKMGPKTLF